MNRTISLRIRRRKILYSKKITRNLRKEILKMMMVVMEMAMTFRYLLELFGLAAKLKNKKLDYPINSYKKGK